jgi:VIT1/CCC1 family predicted Fe2+/Mn2+ transporter
MEDQFTLNAQSELTQHIVYNKLAAAEKNPVNRAALERLSEQENSHYEFWKALTPKKDIAPRWSTVRLLSFLRGLLGVTFITKFLESYENNTLENYQHIATAIPESQKARFNEIVEDEKSNEKVLISQLTEKRVSYIGFIVLGLADAIVEITGVHAGFLGVTGSTLIAGISGVIVGFAAAISMGSASYLQAKQDPEKSAFLSGFATWASYFCSVILLAFPYFLIHTMITAFTVSSLIGIALIAGFTFYGAVVFDRAFLREFTEAVGLMLGTALATFILGTIVGSVFHVHPSSF